MCSFFQMNLSICSGWHTHTCTIGSISFLLRASLDGSIANQIDSISKSQFAEQYRSCCRSSCFCRITDSSRSSFSGTIFVRNHQRRTCRQDIITSRQRIVSQHMDYLSALNSSQCFLQSLIFRTGTDLANIRTVRTGRQYLVAIAFRIFRTSALDRHFVIARSKERTQIGINIVNTTLN